jgi:hypothetical protein
MPFNVQNPRLTTIRALRNSGLQEKIEIKPIPIFLPGDVLVFIKLADSTGC